MKTPISAVILARNEEEHISRVIKQLEFCDEILVIDNNSVDKTAQKAKKLGAIVIGNPSIHFSKLRNIGLKNAKNEWVLFIDADEHVSKALRDEIQEAVGSKRYVSYFLRRYDVFWGRRVEHGELTQARKEGFIRLVKKGSGTWTGDVHEHFVPKGKVGRLKAPIEHHAHDGIHDFLHTINDYSTRRANELFRKGHRTHLLEILCFPCGKFLVTYFFKGGFLDGAPGFVYSIMMSFHSFLVRSKLYLLQTKK